MGYLVKLESVASSKTPEEAVAELVTIADRLGVGVVTTVNNRQAFAFPGEAARDVVRRWQRDTLATSKGHRELRRKADG